MGVERQVAASPLAEHPRHHRRHQKGCLHWTLVGAIVLFVFGLSLAISLFFYGRHLRDSLTDGAATELAVVTLAKDEQKQVRQKYERFLSACRRQAAGKFEFSDRELNAILAGLPECAELRGRVLVEIANGVPWVKASLPLDGAGVSWLKGRYLNGNFRLVVRLDEGSGGLEMFIGDAVVKGGSLPPWLLRRVQKFALTKGLANDRTWGPRIKQLAALEFDLDKLVIRTQKGEK
jgi:hypothetical protein